MYKRCNGQLGQDLNKIKNNIWAYLEYKETSQQLFPHIIQSLAPQNLRNDAPSLFTPLGSWFNRTILNREDIIYTYGEESCQDFFDNNAYFDSYLPNNWRINLAYNAA
ncbi:PIR Superfamily Protein [Plasmodium ovale curtisi]|uniref:PIR Superfamily Protein n=1 Tax=Plasmodium ovale curtisi TaxID=864141 RepID=A0A1A8WVR7_PLAOA|nr:PIR Superfamily Protein [Plasmodium ovale curtisi]SBT01351.1 PIR Superfamily Protein [Plasmodium ovale curtisi]